MVDMIFSALDSRSAHLHFVPRHFSPCGTQRKLSKKHPTDALVGWASIGIGGFAFAADAFS
jgi:hypothetical protein